MKRIIHYIKNIFNNKKNLMIQDIPPITKNLTFLGRWNIDYCNKKINRKVDLSNVDHCGPCGLYQKEK
jgi:hypothetical protein